MVIPERWLKHLALREGSDEKSYYDTAKSADHPRGHLTGGVGHKLTKEEREMYPEGSLIEESVRNKWLEKDSTWAYKAAIKQASELKNQSQEMVEALASVNFQLGPAWHKGKFPSAWKALKKGNYDEAIRQVKYNKKEPSKWSTQTPERTNDFISAIEELKFETENVSAITAKESEKQKEPKEQVSFSETFRESRSSLGPGKEFKWEGKMYSTNTKEEEEVNIAMNAMKKTEDQGKIKEEKGT